MPTLKRLLLWSGCGLMLLGVLLGIAGLTVFDPEPVAVRLIGEEGEHADALPEADRSGSLTGRYAVAVEPGALEAHSAATKFQAGSIVLTVILLVVGGGLLIARKWA
ncbi:MAG: hypothetical protein AAF750_09280 [Planctomycetota bacterium]